jgi:two-component system response regulator
VEDNPDDELLTLDALSGGGMDCEVIVTHDGQEALDYLFATGAWTGRDMRVQPGLMLLDLKLPKLGGFDVLAHVTYLGSKGDFTYTSDNGTGSRDSLEIVNTS